MSEATQHEKDLQAIAEFRMFDDTFMSAVFDGQIAETELLLRVVLGQDDIQVETSEAQFYLSNIYGHEAKLDILARDRQGKAYNVEVQRVLSGASVQRARFNGAMVDVTLLKKGEPHQNLPDRYTIFITEDDMFGKGLPAYHACNTIAELENTPLGDGGYIVYVNGQYRNTDTPIGKLMHDFFCVNADEILNPLLKDRVKYLKETEGGRNEMCQIMENRINEEKIELAKKEIALGELTLAQIARALQLPLPFVEELARPKIA
ncbi:MAG: PD-(D/E)XK nuclease family transposase [Clostridia bacterium]|nr:PD-(D/E)XK nuclease family transposase [Clostridia bacterium]